MSTSVFVRATIALLAACTPASAQQGMPFVTIEARLFKTDSGTFSEDFLNLAAPAIADAGPAREQLLVSVRASSMRGPRWTMVRLVARSPNFAVYGPTVPGTERTVFDGKVETPQAASTHETTYSGFWISRVDCNPLELTAQLLEPTGEVLVEHRKMLFFDCPIRRSGSSQ